MTDSTVDVYDENGDLIVTIYGKYNGYPSLLGAKVFEFLKDRKLIDTFVGVEDNIKVSKGMCCLAAELVGHLKTGPGDIYLIPQHIIIDDLAFTYNVYPNYIKVFNHKHRLIFGGPWEDFGVFCEPSE